uniref:hypothetical protein n=1 Tax=Paracoccus sp. T5 TaxID=3402161 RepID=UPI003ADA963A
FLQNADDLIFGEPAALHLWSSWLGQSLPQTGLGAGGNVSRTAIWVPFGGALSVALFFAQGAPSTDAIVILNAFAQVFVVSTAEVLVCWSVVAGVMALVIERSRWIAFPIAGIVASVLFGIYHFAHSAPFNTVSMVIFLSVIGLLTSAFFFASHDVYATVVFHNFLGVFGVVQAVVAQDNLAAFETLQAPLIGTALITLLVLIALDLLIRRRGLPS